MEKPKPPANATIQIDRLELDEILSVDTGEPSAVGTVPPPLPPEEIARAASLGPSAPVATSTISRRGLLLTVAAMFVVFLAVAIFAGVAVGRAVGRSAPVASASAPAMSSAPGAVSAPAMQTLTIKTVELGGKPTGDD